MRKTEKERVFEFIERQIDYCKNELIYVEELSDQMWYQGAIAELEWIKGLSNNYVNRPRLIKDIYSRLLATQLLQSEDHYYDDDTPLEEHEDYLEGCVQALSFCRWRIKERIYDD